MSVIIDSPDGSYWQITNIGFNELVANYSNLFPEDAEMRH